MANIDPAQALGIFGVMILIVSGITLFAFSHMEIGESADFGAVNFSETNSGIKVTVMEKGSIDHFLVKTNSNTYTLKARPGKNITVNANSVTVYGVNSDGEKTKIDSYSI